MAKNIPGNDDICRTTFRDDTLRDRLAEEIVNRRHTAPVSLLGQIGRVHSQDIESVGAIVFQEIPVVARDLYQKTAGRIAVAVASSCRKPARIILGGFRGSAHPEERRVEVFARNFVANLNQGAAVTHYERQILCESIADIRLVRDECVSKGKPSKIQQ